MATNNKNRKTRWEKNNEKKIDHKKRVYNVKSNEI